MAADTNFKLTYSTMFNPPEELHARFEAALVKVKAGLGREYAMLIDGKERFSAEKFEDRSPSDTDVVLGVFQKGTAQDAADAIAAAKKAFPAWSRTPWQERVALVRKAADMMDQRTFEMGVAMAMEVGKNRMEALGDVAETADLFRYPCDSMEKNNGFVVEMGRDPLVGFESTNLSVLRPYGVWLVISPFNFPAALTGGPSAAALVAGNTVVMKPATDTPWTARLIAECLRDAGVPDGVFNYVTGPGSTLGQALIDQPGGGRGDLHRFVRRGDEDLPGFRPRALGPADDPGAGRQESGHRLAPRQPGRRRHRHHALGVWLAGAEMLSLLARLHRGAGLRRAG